MSIFDPNIDYHGLSHYGEDSTSTLLAHYGTDRSAETLQGEETVKKGMISPDITTEWKTLCQFMAKQFKENRQQAIKYVS